MSVARTPQPAGRRRAILYDRVSTKLQSLTGHSGGADGFQLDRCQTLADARGCDVVGTLTDVDSGAKWEIDGIMQALDLAKRRAYEVLIVSDTSRFARNAAKKAVYEGELGRYGVQVWYTNLPDLPTDDTPDAKFMRNALSGMYGAMDEYDRDKRAWWTKQGRYQKAKRGAVDGGGCAPYGYAFATRWDDARRKDVVYGLVAVEETAEIVRRIFRELREYSTIEIAHRLTADGVPTPSGLGYARVPTRHGTKRARRRPIAVWGATTVRAIVKNAAYRGAWSFAGTDVPVPPLVDPATWHAAQELLTRRRRTRRARRYDDASDDPFTLRGRLVCGGCGGTLATTGGGAAGGPWRQRSYVCLRAIPSKAKQYGWTACETPWLLADDDRPEGAPRRSSEPLVGIEALAWESVSEVLLDPARLARLVASLDAEHAEARADRERRLGILDAEIATAERALARAGAEMVKVDETDPRYAMFAAQAAGLAGTVARFRAERASYAALGPAELAPLDVAALQGVVERTVADVEGASAGDRRRAFAELRLTGTVTREVPGAPGAVRVGERAWVRVEWRPLVESGQRTLALCLLSTPDGPRLLGARAIPRAA